MRRGYRAVPRRQEAGSAEAHRYLLQPRRPGLRHLDCGCLSCCRQPMARCRRRRRRERDRCAELDPRARGELRPWLVQDHHRRILRIASLPSVMPGLGFEPVRFGWRRVRKRGPLSARANLFLRSAQSKPLAHAGVPQAPVRCGGEGESGGRERSVPVAREYALAAATASRSMHLHGSARERLVQGGHLQDKTANTAPMCPRCRKARMVEVATISPLLQTPGLIAYQCPACEHATSTLQYASQAESSDG